jgi:pilus assembly protein CpaE
VTALAATATERAALGVALTGTLDGAAGLRASLEEPGSGFAVLAAVADLAADPSALRNPALNAVLHVVDLEPGSEGVAAALAADVASIRRQTTAPIVLLSARSEPWLVDTALTAGVDDVLVLPAQLETIAFAIHKAGHAGGRVAADARESATGQVITVFSPKGGTGKTVISTNLSAYLAASTSKRVLLIDLDLQFGDAAIMLGLDPKRTMHELVQAPGELDAGKLAGYVTSHRSGLDVLAAPMLPEHADLVTEPKVLRLVEVAREAYDLVVIDTSPFFYGPMLALLGPTDQLLLLCGLDVPTLKNVRLSLRTLELLGFPPERTNLVLNRVTPSVGLTAQDVAEALGMRVAFEVPNDPVVAPAVNRGSVPALHETGSEFAHALGLIASSLQPALAAPPPPAAAQGQQSSPLFRRFVPRRLAEGRV